VPTLCRGLELSGRHRDHAVSDADLRGTSDLIAIPRSRARIIQASSRRIGPAP